MKLTEAALSRVEDRVMISDIPPIPIERPVGGAAISVATDHSVSSTGAAWLLPDGGPPPRSWKDVSRGGVYDTIADRDRQHGA